MLIKVQKSLWNLIYAQMFVVSRKLMYLRTIGRRFTHMNAYFLLMNSKRCNIKIRNRADFPLCRAACPYDRGKDCMQFGI